MKSHEFYNELKHLTELGYLEQTQLDRIQEEYIKDRKENRGIILIFALLGVSFMGAGLISLFACNWSVFSREMKAFIALMPLMGVQGGLYLSVRRNASEIWIKSLTLALGIAFLSALGLIYQAYQISYSLQAMMITGFLLMLPVVYFLDGYYLAVLYLAGICWAGGGGGYTFLVLLLLPYYIWRIQKGESSGLLSLCFFIWLLYLPVLYLPAGACYACVLILLIYATIQKPLIYRKLAGRLLYIMLFVKAVLYLFYNSCAQFLGYKNPEWYFYKVPEILLLLLLAGTVIRVFICCKKKTERERLELILTCVIGGLLSVDLLAGREDYISWLAYEVLVNLCFIACSLYKLSGGVRQANPASVRRYTTAIILYILLKVSFGSYHLLVKGIIFLIAGLAFLVVNYRMTIKLKGVKKYESTRQ